MGVKEVQMRAKRMLIKLGLAAMMFPLGIFAQGQPPMPEPTRTWSPHIVQGPLDWKKMAGVNDNFNRKDAAMALIRTTGIGKAFSEETDDTFVQDFHFLDLKGDRGSEAVYCGDTKYQGWHTYMFVYADQKYHKAFDASGYVHELARTGANWRITLRRDPGKDEYFTVVSKHIWLAETEKDSLLSDLYFPGVSELPQQYFVEEKPMRLGKSEWIRHSPKQQDDPVLDYNNDRRPDVVGNRIIAFKEGHPVSKIAETVRSGQPWAFIVAPVSNPAPGHALGEYKPGLTYVAGWIRSEWLIE